MNRKKQLMIGICLCLVLALCSIGLFACKKKGDASGTGSGTNTTKTELAHYNLSFRVDGRSYATLSTPCSEPINTPEDPGKLGYDFDGWYWDENTWNEPLIIASLLARAETETSLTVYAKFSATVYTISYDTSGGTHQNPGTYTIEESFSLSDPERAGYTFGGWFIGDEEYTKINRGTSGDLTLRAKWTPIQHTITYRLADGTVDETKTYTVEDEFSLKTPVRYGYIFGGYYTADNKKVSEIAKGTIGDIDLSPQWSVLEELKNFYFKFDSTGTECTLTGIKDNTVKTIVIPDFVTNVEIGIFEECQQVESITLPFVGASKQGTEKMSFSYLFGIENAYRPNDKVPASLKKIVLTGGTVLPDFAFANLKDVEEIILPDSLTNTGNYTFEDDKSLKTINLPQNLKAIGNGAFSACTALESITIPASVTSLGSGVFAYTEALRKVEFLCNISSIPNYAFYESGIQTIALPSSVTSIEEQAFRECSFLTEIKLSDNLSSIGRQAFQGCIRLLSIQLPASLTSIDSQAFNGCYRLVELCNLSSLSLEKGSTEFGGVARYALKIHTSAEESSNLSLENDLWIYADDVQKVAVFYIGNAETVTIPDGVQSIFGSAFEWCQNMVTIQLPGSLTRIGDYAFSGCTKLKNISLASVNILGNSAFHNCSQLESVSLVSITQFGTGIFTKCTLLSSVILPDGLIKIPDAMFADCSNLSTITLPSSVTNIGEGAFRGSGLTEIDLSNILVIGDSAFENCSILKSILLTDNVESIGSNIVTGCTRLESLTMPFLNGTLSDFFGGKVPATLKHLVLTTQTNNIVEGAFRGCTSLETVRISGTFTFVAWYAFQDCTSLLSIKLPDTVTAFGQYAFANCKSLTGIVFPKSLDKVAVFAFENCTSLKWVVAYPGVSYMAAEAFKGCSAYAITVYFKGTQTEWENLCNSDDHKYIDNLFKTTNYLCYSETRIDGSINKYWYFDENGDPKRW